MTKITYGEVMTVEEFEANCNMGAYIDYDGSGFYCDGESYEWGKSWTAYPSDITMNRDRNPDKCKFVVWFNK